MNQARLPWSNIAPKPFQAQIGLGNALANSSLGPALMEFVQLRVSQLNGCAFCVDRHTRALRKDGEAWQRINNLSTWRETAMYSARERAALNWSETMTRLVEHHGSRDGDFELLQGQFNDQEIVELSWTIAAINAWNRIFVGMRVPVAEKPIE